MIPVQGIIGIVGRRRDQDDFICVAVSKADVSEGRSLRASYPRARDRRMHDGDGDA